jgi:hypothetical protein
LRQSGHRHQAAGYIFAAGRGNTIISCLGKAHIGGDDDLSFLLAIVVQQFVGEFIGRAIIYNNDLEIGKGLRQNRVNRLINELSLIETGDNYAYRGHDRINNTG